MNPCVLDCTVTLREVRKEKDRITGHLLAEHMENERLEQQEVGLQQRF